MPSILACLFLIIAKDLLHCLNVDKYILFVKNQDMARRKIFSDRRALILKAAERVFEHYGYAKTTMEDIAKEASIPRATVYLDFAGKEEILMASVEEKLQEVLAKMQHLAETSTRSKLETIADIMLVHVLFAHEKSSRYCDPISLGSISHRVRTELGHYLQQEVQLIATLLQQAVEAGELQPQTDFLKTASILSQSMSGYLPPHNLKYTQEEITEQASSLFRWVLGGLQHESC